MNSNTVYSWALLLLLLIQVQARPRPQNNLQTLSRILEEELERLRTQEEVESEADDGEISQEVESVQPELELPWERDTRDFQTRHSLHDGPLTRLLKDLHYSPLRLRSRNKKGSTRGCFGGKLDRIGSMTDLGC